MPSIPGMPMSVTMTSGVRSRSGPDERRAVLDQADDVEFGVQQATQQSAGLRVIVGENEAWPDHWNDADTSGTAERDVSGELPEARRKNY